MSRPPHAAADPFAQMAALMLAQGWQAGPMKAALGIALNDPAKAQAIIDQVLTRFDHPPSNQTLASEIRGDWWDDWPQLPLITVPPRPVFTRFEGLPAFLSSTDLATWLDLTDGQLAWFADVDGRLARRTDIQGHYIQSWIPKRSGGRRLLESPLPRLKALQRKILDDLLAHVPIHPDAMGFVQGRDARCGAARHAGEDVVICVDLAAFFASVRASRIHAMFRRFGYGHPVARLLTGLVTTRTPSDIAAALPFRERSTFTHPHLPQGAPTSPVLANLACWRLDQRMAALARRLGANYSRYADDLTISGDRGLAFESGHPVLEMIQQIVTEEGFRQNPDKTRVQKRGTRQKVTGIIVNQHLNIPRDAYDRLKAILTNCVRHGPTSQNRDGHPDFRAHLDGKIGWVQALNPHRGLKLRSIYNQIDWP